MNNERLEEIRAKERELRSEKKKLIEIEKLEVAKEKANHAIIHFWGGSNKNSKYVTECRLDINEMLDVIDFIIKRRNK